jgi:hypothetical protein
MKAQQPSQTATAEPAQATQSAAAVAAEPTSVASAGKTASDTAPGVARQ